MKRNIYNLIIIFLLSTPMVLNACHNTSIFLSSGPTVDAVDATKFNTTVVVCAGVLGFGSTCGVSLTFDVPICAVSGTFGGVDLNGNSPSDGGTIAMSGMCDTTDPSGEVALPAATGVVSGNTATWGTPGDGTCTPAFVYLCPLGSAVQSFCYALTIQTLGSPTNITSLGLEGAGVDGSGTGCNESFTDITSLPLPITLTHFTGESLRNKVQLEWTTEREIDNDMFIIERSNDRVNFESIGEILGAGTTNQQREYQFDDTRPIEVAYYKLKSVDFSGGIEYSKVIAVRSSGIPVDFNVFPVPASNTVNVKVTSNGNNISMRIMDLTGKEVFNKTLNATSRGNLVSMAIDVNQFPNGYYQISLSDGIHNTSKPLIIAH